MTAKDAIKTALAATEQVFGMYLADLSDADLLVRPVPGANHIAWQIGHLIHSEKMLAGQLPGASYPELPAGFGDSHASSNAGNTAATGFLSKNDYLKWFTQIRKATITNLMNLADSDLDKPTQGQMAHFAPTLGDLLILVSNHTLMHAGQFTVVRRKLGKPVIF